MRAARPTEVAKELCPDVPFIIVSGEIDLNLAVSLMRGGAQNYIPKGELARLVPVIARELRDVEGRRERQRAEAALREHEARFRFWNKRWIRGPRCILPFQESSPASTTL
jgi:DNA-binding NtrC family response regulator